jgi:hypothetical protein
MTRRDAGVLSIASFLIKIACRRLPVEIRDEYIREWIGELHAILDDPDRRWWLSRATQTILYAADQQRSTLAMTGVQWWRALGTLVSKTALAVVFGALVAISPMAGHGIGKYVFSGGEQGKINSAKNRLLHSMLVALCALPVGLFTLGPAVTAAIASGILVTNIALFFATGWSALSAEFKAARAKELQLDRP